MGDIEKVKLLDCDLEKVVLSGPLSRDTMFTLHIKGPWTPREATNLIRMIELQKDWLIKDEVKTP